MLRCCGNMCFRLWCVYWVPCDVRLSRTPHGILKIRPNFENSTKFVTLPQVFYNYFSQMLWYSSNTVTATSFTQVKQFVRISLQHVTQICWLLCTIVVNSHDADLLRLQYHNALTQNMTHLAFYSLAVISHTTSFNNKKFDMVFTLHYNAVCGLLPSTTLTDRFCVTEVGSVFCAVRTESLYKTDTFRLERVKLLLHAFPKSWTYVSSAFPLNTECKFRQWKVYLCVGHNRCTKLDNIN